MSVYLPNDAVVPRLPQILRERPSKTYEDLYNGSDVAHTVVRPKGLRIELEPSLQLLHNADKRLEVDVVKVTKPFQVEQRGQGNLHVHVSRGGGAQPPYQAGQRVPVADRPVLQHLEQVCLLAPVQQLLEEPCRGSGVRPAEYPRVLRLVYVLLEVRVIRQLKQVPVAELAEGVGQVPGELCQLLVLVIQQLYTEDQPRLPLVRCGWRADGEEVTHLLLLKCYLLIVEQKVHVGAQLTQANYAGEEELLEQLVKLPHIQRDGLEGEVPESGALSHTQPRQVGKNGEHLQRRVALLQLHDGLHGVLGHRKLVLQDLVQGSQAFVREKHFGHLHAALRIRPHTLHHGLPQPRELLAGDAAQQLSGEGFLIPDTHDKLINARAVQQPQYAALV